MPLAKTKRDRAHQVKRWLESLEDWESPFPVSLRVLGPDTRAQLEGAMGDTRRIGKRIWIRLDGNIGWYMLIDTLLHEWVHAHLTTYDHVEKRLEELDRFHDLTFQLKEAMLRVRFHEEGGAEEACDY